MKKLIKVWIIGALAVGYLAIFGVSSALDPTAYLGGSYDGYGALDSIDAAFGGPSVTISSAADQHFAAGSGITAISPITITDSTGAAVTALNDIRIRIPSGFNMEWDATDTAAAISGTASSKVNAAVTYEGANKVVVLNVNSDFLAGEYITVSGLSFTNFSAASSVDYLGLDIYNAGGNFARDNKAISISLAADFRYSGGSYDGYNTSVSAGVVLSGLNGDNFLVSPSPNPASVNTTPNVTITITARDASNAVITSYAPVSTVSITKTESGSTAGSAILSKISLAAVDFTNGAATVTLYDTEPENVAVTAVDQSYASTAGTSVPITFTPGALASFTITGYPAAITAGSNFGANNIVVTAKDALGNVKTDYAGTVYFTSTDAQAVLPYTSAAKYTFVAGDNGTHTFAGTGFTLKTSPSATVTVTDGTISQASSAITITPGGIDHYTITTTTPETAGTGWSEIVKAYDAANNQVTTDSSTVVTMSSNNISGGGATYSVGGAAFNYRKSIPITGSTSWSAAQTNYQVPIDPQIYNNTGLVGSWHFSEGTGTSVADMSGNGNTGTWAGAGAHWTTSGKFGNGGVFNGTDDYVNISSITPMPTSASLSFWVYMSNWGDGIMRAIFDTNNGTGDQRVLIRKQTDNTLYFYMTKNGLDDVSILSSALSGSGWKYIVATYTAGSAKLYIDSTEVGSDTTFTMPTFASYSARIGRAVDGNLPFNGSIDEVKIYNRALSADEISQQYNNGSPKVRHDYQDIRFTNAAGTELPYWQETDSKFWVKADNIPNTTAGTTLNMYYGNPSATFGGANANNGANTFDFFDDFSGSIDWANKWSSANQGLYSTSSGVLTATGTLTTGNLINSINTFNNIILETRMKWDIDDNGAYFAFNPTLNTFGNNDIIYRSNPNSFALVIGGSQDVQTSSAYVNTYYRLKLEIPASGNARAAVFSDGGTLIKEKIGTPTSRTAHVAILKYGGGTISNDWILVRKYASPEPVPGTPGAEQGNGSAQFYTDTNYNVLKPNSQYTLSAGQVTIYSKDTKAETITLTSFDTVNNKSVTSGSIVINPAAAYKATLTAPASVTAGVVSGAFTLTSLDTYGNTQNVVANTVFNLTSNSTGTVTFYSDAGGTLPITSATINAASSSATFYYKDTKTSVPTITATYASGDTMNPTTATASLTVNPAAIASYSVSTTSPTQTAGVGWSETVTAKDAFGNIVTTGPGTQVTLTSNKVSSPALSNAGGGVWLYGKKLTLNGSSTTGTNYQMKLLVGESSATAGTNVNVDGHSSATSGIFDDVRFADSTQSAAGELKYWLEGITGTAPNRIATFWVKISADLSAGQNPDIYMYYGNPSATSASNGANTFDFFDDFNDNNISDWTAMPSTGYGGSGADAQSGQIHVGGTSTSTGSRKAFSASSAVWEATLKRTGQMNDGRFGKTMLALMFNGAGNYWPSDGYVVQLDTQFDSNAPLPNSINLVRIDAAGAITNIIGTANNWNPPDANPHNIKVTRSPANLFELFVDGISKGTAVDSTYSSLPYIGFWGIAGTGSSQKDFWMDNLRVRKYASPEPSVGAPGTEILGSGASSAKFYTSLANANSDTGGLAILSYTLSSGTVPIYVRDNKVEIIVLTATDAGSKTGTSDAIAVGVAPANKVVFTSTAQTLVAGAASTAYTVEVRDQFDNLRTGDALALTLASSSSTGKFDTSAGGAFNGTVTSITTSGGIGTFYYKDTVTGTPTITVSYTGLTSGTQAQTITAGSITPTLTHSSYKAGATAGTTISFTTANPIPLNGDVEVTFDQNYDLSGVLGVSGNSGATVTASDQTAVINLGTPVNANTLLTLVVSGIKNPLVLGATGTYAVKTQDASDALIDQGTVSANTIVIPTFTLLTPSDAGITLSTGQNYNITWSNDGAISDNLSLYYANEGGLVYPGSPNIASAVANSGTYTWTVPDDPRLAAKVKIEDAFYQVMKETTDTQFNQGTYANTEVTGAGNSAGVKITAGAGGLSAWQYQVPINISGSTSWSAAQTNYQVPIDPQIYNNTGLVGSWHFSEGTGTGVADMSGNNNTGTWNGAGAHWAASGKFGNGGVFNGTSDYVEIANESNFRLTTGLTTEAWVKRTGTKFQIITAKMGEGSTASSLFRFYITDTNNLGFMISNEVGSAYIYKLDNAAIDTNWHHVVGVWDGGTSASTNLKLYKDGTLITDSTSAGGGTFTGSTAGNQPFRIGASVVNNIVNYFFNGSIDEVKIYNRALSAEEILQRYNNGSPKVRHDYQDIRFTNASGTELPYWQETDSKFWVNVDNIPNTVAGTTLNMYYGNLAATFGGANANNGTNTFDLFNAGDTLSGWVSNGGSIVNNKIQVSGVAGSIVGSQNTVSRPSILEWTANFDASNPGNHGFSNRNDYAMSTDDGEPRGVFFHHSTNGNIYTALKAPTITSVAVGGTNSNYRNYKIIWGSTVGDTKFYIDNSLASTPNANFPSDTSLYVFFSTQRPSTGSTQNIYNIRVRKYASPEPVVFMGQNEGSYTVGVDTFSRKKPINISGSTSWAAAQTNYQVAVDPQIYNNTGLVGSWHFSEGTGTSVADMSGNGNTGTWAGAGTHWTTSGKFGNGGTFNGTSDYVDMPYSSTFPTTVWTVSAWIKTTSSNVGVLGRYRVAGCSNGMWPVEINAAGKLTTFHLNTGCTPGNSVTSTASVNTGNWTYITVVWNASTPTMKIYINGVLDSESNTYTGTPSYSTGATFDIGFGSTPFNGSIDEVKFYNRALSADEISQQYNNGTPKVRHDYQDIRFTNAAGTELPYWQETDSKFWVKADNIPNTTAGATINMYYGNPTATFGGVNANNGTNTFVAFDDFEGAGLLSWTNGANNETWANLNGYRKQTNTVASASPYMKTSYINISETNYIVHAKFYAFGVNIGGNTRQGLVTEKNAGDAWYLGTVDYTNNANSIILDTAGGSPPWAGAAGLGFTVVANTWYDVDMLRQPNVQKVSIRPIGSSISWTTQLTRTSLANTIAGLSGGYDTEVWYDDFYVRKYASPEPMVSALQEAVSNTIFTSRVLDTGGAQSYGKLEWTANIPAQCGANAVKFQLASAAADTGPWTYYGPTSTSDYYTASGTQINSIHNGARYIRYKAYLATADVNYTPTLQEVKIGFASPTTANRVISSESANTFIMAGKTSAYYLSAPADIAAGNTAQYTVTRKDSKGTLVTVGAETVTLASTSTGANKQFRATAGGAALSPSEITIPDGSSSVDFYYYDEKMGAYSITTSRTGVTSATDSINVLHAAADHLRFQNNITTPQKVGTSFMLPLLEAVDKYGNILNSDYGATAYTGAKTISYSLSGLANAPKGTPVDSWTTSVPFTNGVSNVTTDLITTLYRAQTTTIAAGDALLPAIVANVASNSIVVGPELAVSLKFTQQPSATSLTNVALALQPAVSIQDTYGNQTHDTTSITIYDSTLDTSYVDGTGTISAAANPISAVDGLAAFSGVKYNGFPDSASSTIYLYAQAAGLSSAYSTAITFNVASTSSVSAVTAPVANFNLIPTNDTEAEKFAVLKFKVTDAGDDGIATLIDGIKVTIGGSGLNASTDIAWAELYDDTGAASVSSVTGAAITNTQILFGAAADSNSLAGLGASIANGTSRDYTVYIYMKPGKLTAVEGNTYAFDVDETGVYADLAYSSKMAADSLAIAPVTGTIQVAVSHIEVATEAGASSLSLNAGVGANIILRATDANKNIDSNYTGNHTFIFSGLNSITTYNPKVDATDFGVNKTIGFTNGVSTAALLKAYKKEIGAVSVTESGQSYLCHPLSVDVAAISASKISISSGNSQVTAINTALLQPYVAFISDLYGNPVSAVSAAFAIASAPAGATGQSLSVVSGSSAANGQISTILTMGNLAGTYAVSVTSTGLTGSPLSFTSNALAPSVMNKVSGNNPSGKKVTEILSPFVVQLLDAASTPIPNVTVNFAIASTPLGATGQALSASQSVTDSTGQASTILTLGNKTGAYTVTATYGSYTQTFTVSANPQPPYKVVLSGPSAVNAGEASLVFTMDIQDQYNNASPVSANTVFNLTNAPSAAGGFYSDSAGTISLGTQITVAGAASSNTFYYKDTATGNPLIGVSRASGDALTTPSASSSLTVTPAGLSYFKVTGSTATMTTGGSRAITVTAYDSHGNIKTNADSAINIIFSGANSSPSATAPTCTNNAAADIAFGTSTALNFVNGVAASTFKAYKAETVNIKAGAGAAATSDANDLDIIVKHAAVDHLKFSAAFTEPQGGFKAGTAFTLSALNAVDLYGNICDGANGATAYSGTKVITYTLSGTANAPDGSASDTYTNTVVFAAGVSTSTLDTTLYRAQATTITASDAVLSGTNTASGSIIINPKPVSKLFFTQQPSTTSLTNVALAQQPIVSVSDMYGNAVSSASDQITLKASTTTGTYTAAANGTLSGAALSVTLVNGSAAFSGLQYSYPETIYLKASAANAAVADIYSFGIAFGTASTDGTTAAGALVEPAEVSSTAYADESRVNVFDFKVSDAGTDGFGIPIKQIKINRNTPADTTGGWSTYIAGAKISDGTTTFLGTVTDNVLTFGAGTSTIYTVANAGNKTFTLSIYFKQSLPAGADGKFLAFSIDPNDDITVDTVGSQFAPAAALSSSSKVQVTITKFMLTGSASSMLAGNGITVNVKGTDINGNIDSDYAGAKEIIFSGASTALAGTKPTCTNYSAVGVDFGGITLINFASGQSSSAITMKLYKAEAAAIKATTSDSLIVTSAADALNITVTGGSANKLSWLTQPASTVVAGAPWKSFSVGVTDAYGNTTSSAITVTIAPAGGTLSAGAVNSAAAASGVATFSDFAVSCASYPGTVTVSAAAAGVTGSGPSNDVTVAEKYAITIKTLDSVNGSALTAITLKILDANTGALVTGLTNPITGNSPFNLSLPYGKYQFNITKDAYVESTTEKTPLPADDGTDGTYDNNITWSIFVMSVAESLADYKIVNNFIYDEDLDQIAANLRLEKRGKQIVDDAINTLKLCTLDIYTSSDAVTPIYSASLALPNSQGIYWFYIPNATASGKFVSGKSYFTKMTLKYGGAAESANTTYSSVSTFDIGVAARLKTWTSEIKAEVAGVKATVSTEARTIEKTVADKVTAEAEATRTKVTEKAAEIKVETAKILTAAETTIPGKITTAQEAISTTLTTEVKPHVKSGILNRENLIRTGDTITVRYRTITGLSPTLSIYDPKNALKVSAAAMTEVGATGVYEYKVKFLNAWGTGEFTIVCSESTQGTVDAQIISVTKHDIEEIAGQVSAVLGSTSGITGLKNITDTIGLQFSDMDRLLAKISKDVAGKLGEAKSAVNDLSSAFKQLEDMSKQIKNIGGTKGINLEKLYEVSKDKKEDINYLKNKSEELKAAMELNQKMLENAGKKPVVQTWFEFK